MAQADPTGTHLDSGFHLPVTGPTPGAVGFTQPAEWQLHRACWLAWPSHGELWKEDLRPAQAEFTALCQAIAEGEGLEILVPHHDALEDTRKALAGLNARFHLIPFGDVWLRDTAPVFLLDRSGAAACVRFGFNGWGGKYILPGDDGVSSRIAAVSGLPTFRFPWVLEGGSVDVDGEGTCLTTRQCLLNPNRNPGWKEADLERALREALGVSRVLWLNEGLLNDHTDGHVDTLARFVAPGIIACMQSTGAGEDPNHRVLEEIARDLARFTDSQGRFFKVVRVPSPGKVVSDEGTILPASYMNFYIANTTVIVPTYGSPHDGDAVEAIASLFPTRRTVGLPAKAILTGGGSFHCITQQQPLGATRWAIIED